MKIYIKAETKEEFIKQVSEIIEKYPEKESPFLERIKQHNSSLEDVVDYFFGNEMEFILHSIPIVEI